MVALSQVGLTRGHDTGQTAASVSDALGLGVSSSSSTAGVELYVSGLGVPQFALALIVLVVVSMIAGSGMTILVIYACGGEIRHCDRHSNSDRSSSSSSSTSSSVPTAGEGRLPRDPDLQPKEEEEQPPRQAPASTGAESSSSMPSGTAVVERCPDAPTIRSRRPAIPAASGPAQPATHLPRVSADGSNDAVMRARRQELCPKCEAEMILRTAHHGGYFFGCVRFPSCRGTRRPLNLPDGGVLPGRG